MKLFKKLFKQDRKKSKLKIISKTNTFKYERYLIKYGKYTIKIEYEIDSFYHPMVNQRFSIIVIQGKKEIYKYYTNTFLDISSIYYKYVKDVVHVNPLVSSHESGRAICTCCRKIDRNYVKLPKDAVYSNFIILCSECYKKFENLLKKVISLIEKSIPHIKSVSERLLLDYIYFSINDPYLKYLDIYVAKYYSFSNLLELISILDDIKKNFVKRTGVIEVSYTPFFFTYDINLAFALAIRLIFSTITNNYFTVQISIPISDLLELLKKTKIEKIEHTQKPLDNQLEIDKKLNKIIKKIDNILDKI